MNLNSPHTPTKTKKSRSTRFFSGSALYLGSFSEKIPGGIPKFRSEDRKSNRIPEKNFCTRTN